MHSATAAAGELKKKIHRHVEVLLIAPPRIGPTRSEIEKAIDTKPVYAANFSCGTSSKNIAKDIAYMPAPPMP